MDFLTGEESLLVIRRWEFPSAFAASMASSEKQRAPLNNIYNKLRKIRRFGEVFYFIFHNN